MASFDFLNKFRPSEIRTTFRNFLVRNTTRLGKAVGLDVVGINQKFRERGWGDLATEVSTVLQEISESEVRFNYYSRLPPNEVPNTDLFEQVNWTSDKYGYVYEFDVFDMEGNIVGTQTARIDTGDVLTQEQLLESAFEQMFSRYGARETTFSEPRIRGALSNPNFIEG